MIYFSYLRPDTLEEAIDILQEHGNQAKVLAGGTDLLICLRQRTLRPRYVVSLKHVPGLKYIRYNRSQGLRLGALTTIGDIETSEVVRQHYPMLAEAASGLGSVQIRNLATVGGNLCNAAPSADMAPGLIGLRARAVVEGPEERYSVALEDFFQGPGRTILGPADILVEIRVPPPSPHTGAVYLSLSPRRAMDIPVVDIAAVVRLAAANGVCQDVRLVMGAVAPTPRRARRAEEVLRGQTITDELINRAAARARREARPITDVRASADYRREMVAVLSCRALRQALELAQAQR